MSPFVSPPKRSQVWLCGRSRTFIPMPVDEALHGKFYEADCYIILKVTQKINNVAARANC